MKKNIKTALIVVDLQNEYIDGALSIPYAENIVKKVNKISDKFDVVCFIKNINNKKKLKELERVTISDTSSYCIDGTRGVEFPPELMTNDNIFERKYDIGFSAVKSKNDKSNLLDFLKENNITHVFICGVPGDYSVKYTAFDMSSEFNTYVIIDMVKTISSMNNLVRHFIEKRIPVITMKDSTLIIDRITSDKPFYTSKKKNNKEYNITFPKVKRTHARLWH